MNLLLYLKDCKDFHQAKDGDGWVEQSSQHVLFGLIQKVFNTKKKKSFRFSFGIEKDLRIEIDTVLLVDPQDD